MLLAALTAIVTVLACWLAWARVRDAMVGEFDTRLIRVAHTAASQISPQTVEDARVAGEDGGGYLAVQVQLVTLRGATGLAEASLIDTTRATLVDARAPEDTERLPSALDTLAAQSLELALRGRATISPPYVRGGVTLRAALAPVIDHGGAIAVVAVEAEPTYLAPLESLARRLVMIALLSFAAIVAFTALLVRNALAAARLEQRLSRAENLAAMGQLTATLAHEIKNPLAIIRGSAERLQCGDSEQQRMAQFVIEESDRLSRTVARYLEFARGEQIPGEHGDAIAALEATLALLEGEFKARGVTLDRSRGSGDSATVRLDPESLKQVFLNLLLNAMEAMPDGGSVRVSDRLTAGNVEIVIADQGPGIPAELLRRLGSPFVTTKAQGSGLGLFLARRLAQSAGGDLAIESGEGHGTACSIRLPRVKE